MKGRALAFRRGRAALAAWQGDPPTSYELAEVLPADRRVAARFEYARRLADLRERRLVENGPKPRACRVTGKQALTWTVTDAGRAALGASA